MRSRTVSSSSITSTGLDARRGRPRASARARSVSALARPPRVAGSGVRREANREGRALSGRARDGDVAAHHAAEAPADRQAEAGPAVLARGRGVGLRELLEQPAPSARRSCRCPCPRPRMLTQSRPRSSGWRVTATVIAPALGELAGVAGEVEQRLAEPRRVGPDHAERRRDTPRRPRSRSSPRAAGSSRPRPRPGGRRRPTPGESSSLPASIFERSRMSLIRASRCCPRGGCARGPRSGPAGPPPARPRGASRVTPMMALSGVRSSWLMLARNCDLWRLATSSSRPLSWISWNRRAFSTATAACAANVWRRSTV